MVQLTTRERVDAFWSNTFDLSAADLRSPGVRVRPHTPSRASWRAVYVLGFDDAACVLAPADLVPLLLEAVTGRAAGDVLDPSPWSGVLGGSARRVVATRHHYLDERTGLDAHAAGRRINPRDHSALAALRSSIPPREWEQAGFGSQPAMMFGVFEGEEMVAVANLGPGPDAATDIGVVVRPRVRGKGYGTQATATAARQAVLMHGVARLRAPSDHEAAFAVARRLGFSEYGRDVTVQLSG
jgi:hypothetical protein